MAKLHIDIVSRSGKKTATLSGHKNPATPVPAVPEAIYQVSDETGQALTDIQFSRTGQDLLVQDPASGEQLRLERYFDTCASNCNWQAATGNGWVSMQAGGVALENLPDGQSMQYQWVNAMASVSGAAVGMAALPGWVLPSLGGVALVAAAAGSSSKPDIQSDPTTTLSGTVSTGPVLSAGSPPRLCAPTAS